MIWTSYQVHNAAEAQGNTGAFYLFVCIMKF